MAKMQILSQVTLWYLEKGCKQPQYRKGTWAVLSPPPDFPQTEIQGCSGCAVPLIWPGLGRLFLLVG